MSTETIAYTETTPKTQSVNHIIVRTPNNPDIPMRIVTVHTRDNMLTWIASVRDANGLDATADYTTEEVNQVCGAHGIICLDADEES